ncbi:metalloregulator ArsR/SmtB family transcription factor [Mucilaginibacter sp.]|uniref:metalloregulator ArsR/SmtB family transcription factor n=1 Tax=Mucilaginibacter sp. TaxID=1882438 RepID=UPI0035BC2FF6
MRRDVFQAIADPTRRDIINLLANSQLNLNAVADNFTISRPAISKHIKILTECGLVIIKQQGRERYCHADLKRLKEVASWADQYRAFWTGKLDALENFLENEQTKTKIIMEAQPLIVERTLNASAGRIWQALTDNDQMKNWYFQLEHFEARVGFEFKFKGGTKEKQYLHKCRITAVEPEKKLSYTWQYDAFPGQSEVTFELFPESDDKTLVRITHTGLDSFPKDDPNFAVASFTKGWNHILGTSLKAFVEA